jgi:hypothetical protein
LLCALLALGAAASAQERVSEDEGNARMNVLSLQRNQAMDTVVVLQARLMTVEAALKKAQDEAAKCPSEKAKDKDK